MAGAVESTQRLVSSGEIPRVGEGIPGDDGAASVARATTMAASDAAAGEDPLAGRVLGGRYRLEQRLGAGAMGAVYRARHVVLERPVAVKVLRPEVAHKPSVAERFEREALAASQLDHPNCVQVLDAGTTDDGVRYLVMPLLEGRDLRTCMNAGLGAEQAIDLALQVLCGLGHAHRRGFVHRDVKPENVIVVEDDDGRSVAKLVDFGLVKLLDLPRGKTITRVGFVFGTPWYMSPEQAAGERVDARADLYAVGAMLYEMLSGAPPFDADSMSRVLYMHVAADPEPLPSSVPAGVAAVVMRLLAKEPWGRYESARAAAEALQAAAAHAFGSAFWGTGASGLSASGREARGYVLGAAGSWSSMGPVPSLGEWSQGESVTSVAGWSDGGALLGDRVPTASGREVDSLLGGGGRGQKVFGAFAGLMTVAIGVFAAAFLWSRGPQTSGVSTESVAAAETEVSEPAQRAGDGRLAQAEGSHLDGVSASLGDGEIEGPRGSAVEPVPVKTDPNVVEAEKTSAPAPEAPEAVVTETPKGAEPDKPKAAEPDKPKASKPKPKSTPKPSPEPKRTTTPSPKEPAKVLRPTKPPRTSDPASKLPSSSGDEGGEKRRLSPLRPPRQA